MTWSRSGFCGSWFAAVGALGSDNSFAAVSVATFNSTPTPSSDADPVTRYNEGEWVSSGREVFDPATWPQGGQALSRPEARGDGDTVRFVADPFTSGGLATMASVYGDLIWDAHDRTAAALKPGICFHYYGGPVSVTNGLWRIMWHPSAGVAVLTVEASRPAPRRAARRKRTVS